MKKINVAKYGILPNTGELLTEKIQALIDRFRWRGVELYFPAGAYVLSTIFLRNNTTINISRNALILGSNNFDDYAKLEEVDYKLYQDVSHSFFNCALFVGKNVNNVSIIGKGMIDMRSVWDENNVNNMVHRGAKVIALKECTNIKIKDLRIINATDLAVYLASCQHAEIDGLKLKVYIDGISPDNSKDIKISNCDIISGDDGICFKSSYNLNRLDTCERITVEDCVVASRCNAIKFGTESNGGFKDISIKNIKVRNTRITGISIESVDGAIINNISIDNVEMENVNAPLFIHLGARLRGPEGTKVGKISNIFISNLTAKGPYKPYKTVPWNYDSFKKNDTIQYPWHNGLPITLQELNEKKKLPWQYTCNVCGYKENMLEEIYLKNVHLELEGGIEEFDRNVREDAGGYPEVFVYGKILPAKGIYFRHINGLHMANVKIVTYKEDKRDDFFFDDVMNRRFE